MSAHDEDVPWIGAHALVVGRDARGFTAVRDMLHYMGLCSTYAATVAEAVLEAHYHRPALLIVDVDAAQLQSGLWLARTLRAQYGTSVLFVTDEPDGAISQLIADAGGGGGVLRRSFRHEQIAQILRLILDWHHLRVTADEVEEALCSTGSANRRRTDRRAPAPSHPSAGGRRSTDRDDAPSD